MSVTLESNLAEVSRLKIEGRAFIDGAYVGAKSGQTFSCISPGTGRAQMAGITAYSAKQPFIWIPNNFRLAQICCSPFMH